MLAVLRTITYQATLVPGPFGRDGEAKMMKRFQAIVGATVIILAAWVAKPAGAENVVRWASATEPLTFDPHSANIIPTNAANLQVHEPLVDFNSRYEIEPALAVAWKLISPTTWQFDLRPGVRFHDGTPFTSEDVVFSLNRALSETSDFKGDLPPITTVAAIDDHTVQITTAAPDPVLPEELNAIFIMSKRWAEQHDALLPAVYGEKVTYAENHANGTGPFKLVSFEPGVGSVMTRNYDWWGLGQNPHNLDGIVAMSELGLGCVKTEKARRRLESSSPKSAISRRKYSVSVCPALLREIHSSDRFAGCVFTRPGSRPAYQRLSTTGDRFRFLSVGDVEELADDLVSEGVIQTVEGDDHFEAMAGICGGDYKAEGIVRLRRIETSETAGRFDADSIFFTDDFPSAEGVRDFDTCKWAYERVSTDRPDVPKCERPGIRPTKR